MNWTKKHDELCLIFGLRPSATYLYRCINRKTKGNTTEEITLDLREFNNWVAKKRGRPYDPKTLKEAIAQLLERTNGLITLIERVNWYYYRIAVKPASFFSQKKSQKSGLTPTQLTKESSLAAMFKNRNSWQQQQDLDLLDTLLQKFGLKYDRSALNRIWSFSGKCIERVKEAIELMLYRHQTTPISKPHGFLIDCLKYNWADGFDPYYEPELPLFSSLDSIIGFVKNKMPSFVT